MNPERAIAYRKQVSALIDAVLTEDISARAALNCWPMAGNQDSSVRCAYTMMWYFEADEDRHHLELFYADMQIQNLRDANSHLKKGDPLPENLIQEYKARKAPSEYAGSWTWREPLVGLQQLWERLVDILETHPKLRRPPKTKGPRS